MRLANVLHGLKAGNGRDHTSNRQEFGEMLFRKDCSTQNSFAICAAHARVEIPQEANGAGDRSHREPILVFLVRIPRNVCFFRLYNCAERMDCWRREAS
jgi:hypothetical protein